MDKVQFTGLTKIYGEIGSGKLNTAAAIGNRLAKHIAKYVNQQQEQTLIKKHEDVFYMNRSGKLTVRKPKKDPVVDVAAVLKDDPSMKVTSLTAVLGPYGSTAAAEVDAKEFQHESVFQYRSALFPNPQSYGVVVKIDASEVVELTDATPLAPYGVSLDIRVLGDPKKTASWISRFEAQTRLHTV